MTMTNISAKRDFITSGTSLESPSACPEIKLHLATAITPIWQASESFLHGNNLAPPYWAFAWAGGQGLARHVLDSPWLVRGRRVLDFGAGSGIVAIAAALAGAQTVEAADIDVYWKYEIWARQRHSHIDSIFNTTGCIYALRRSLAEPIPSDTLVDDAIIPLRAFFRGYRVVIDTEALAFDYGVVRGGEFRRKLRTLGGVWQAWVRMPQLFTSANRMRMHFLAHKFGRLALPWMILVGVLAAWLLPDTPVRSTLLFLALLVLALAALDPFLPKTFALRCMSSPARSFVVLNVAALLSVLVFFVPPKILWKPTRLPSDTTDVLLSKQSENKP